ncbi:MAG: hypothetical protein EA405_14830 [Rhodospirillales bacterium]|nr:MAG: hypothetical protein EA405_14830 [Rhodospirillales bacterium]
MTAAGVADGAPAGLSPERLLWAWEHGSRRHPVDRALLVLKAALPSSSDAALAGIGIGQRDALLLKVRAATFGPMLDARALCPACGETVSFTANAHRMLAATETEGEHNDTFAIDGFRLRLRVPDSRDLAAAAATGDAQAARELLLDRCVVGAWRGDAAVAARDLPDSVVERAVHHLADREAAADVTFALACPACGHQWSAPLDAESFLWAEIAAEAERVARAVDTLARTYGWSEAEILGLSPARRQLYLQLAG